jgi:hypothetical protein
MSGRWVSCFNPTYVHLEGRQKTRDTEVLATSTIDQLASKKAPRSDAMASYRLRQTQR